MGRAAEGKAVLLLSLFLAFFFRSATESRARDGRPKTCGVAFASLNRVTDRHFQVRARNCSPQTFAARPSQQSPVAEMEVKTKWSNATIAHAPHTNWPNKLINEQKKKATVRTPQSRHLLTPHSSVWQGRAGKRQVEQRAVATKKNTKN